MDREVSALDGDGLDGGGLERQLAIRGDTSWRQEPGGDSGRTLVDALTAASKDLLDLAMVNIAGDVVMMVVVVVNVRMGGARGRVGRVRSKKYSREVK